MMGGVSPDTCWASYKYGIINSSTRSHLVGYFYKIYITSKMHGSINIKFIKQAVIFILAQLLWKTSIFIEQKKIKSWNSYRFVKNTTEIMQRVLKMQQVPCCRNIGNDLTFVDPCIIVYNSQRKPNKVQECIKILFHIYMKLNMFRATHHPSSRA
jgi:hypothetical protein